MRLRVLSVALILVGAALVTMGVRSYLISRSSLPAPPVAVTTAPPIPVPGDTCCILEIPRLKARMSIIEGTRPGDLERAPGRFIRSARPGQPGNCAISGHRDTHFRVLRKLRDGDRILVTDRGEIFEYIVKTRRVIKPSDVWILEDTPEPTLTLLTCYPFTYIGPAPKRFALQATLVDPTT